MCVTNLVSQSVDPKHLLLGTSWPIIGMWLTNGWQRCSHLEFGAALSCLAILIVADVADILCSSPLCMHYFITTCAFDELVNERACRVIATPRLIPRVALGRLQAWSTALNSWWASILDVRVDLIERVWKTFAPKRAQSLLLLAALPNRYQITNSTSQSFNLESLLRGIYVLSELGNLSQNIVHGAPLCVWYLELRCWISSERRSWIVFDDVDCLVELVGEVAVHVHRHVWFAHFHLWNVPPTALCWLYLVLSFVGWTLLRLHIVNTTLVL